MKNDLLIPQEHLLSALAKLPDDEWLTDDLTADQREYWHELKRGYLKLGDELDAFFSGRETTLGNTKTDREIGIIADYYITLYWLIQINFSAIKKFFQKVYCPPDLAEIEELDSPATLFKSLLWCEALSSFDLCTRGHFTWTPSGSVKERKLIGILRDKSISRHKRLEAQRRLKPRINSLRKSLQNSFDPHFPKWLVLEACYREAPKNQRLKNKLDDFNLCFERLEQTSFKNLRKKAQGFGFSKGDKIYPTRYGGSWRKNQEGSST